MSAEEDEDGGWEDGTDEVVDVTELCDEDWDDVIDLDELCEVDADAAVGCDGDSVETSTFAVELAAVFAKALSNW